MNNHSDDKKYIKPNLIVGLSVLLFIFVFFAGILWFKHYTISRETVTYTVLFPDVGTLKSGDPVLVNGLKQGMVSNICLDEKQVTVLITVDQKIVLTDSCVFSIQNIGLMGERVVGIQLSDKGQPYPPNVNDKVTYIKGNFDSGISESMMMAGEVFDKGLNLIDTVSKIFNHTVGDSECIDIFRNSVNRLDNIVLLVKNLISENKSDIKSSVDNIALLKSEIDEILNFNSKNITRLKRNGKQLSNEANLIKNRIDSVATAIKNIVSGIEDGKGSVGVVVSDTSVVEDIKRTIEKLDTIVNEIYDNGLKIRVKPGLDESK